MGYRLCMVHQRSCVKAKYYRPDVLLTFSYQTNSTAMYVQCESKKSPLPIFCDIFPKRLGIFGPNFTHLLHVAIYARLQIFIQLSPTLTKLCHNLYCVGGDITPCSIQSNPSYAIFSATTIICSKCPPSVETHAGQSHLI